MGPFHSDRQPRVLLVDDDALVVRGLTRSLARDSVVTSALTGQLALDLVLSQSQTFDVIVCDLFMAGMSGAELHAQLSLRAPEMAERMIFLSGDVSSRRATVFLDTVSNVRLEKPVDIESLRAAICEGCSHNGSLRTSLATAS